MGSLTFPPFPFSHFQFDMELIYAWTNQIVGFDHFGLYNPVLDNCLNVPLWGQSLGL